MNPNSYVSTPADQQSHRMNRSATTAGDTVSFATATATTTSSTTPTTNTNNNNITNVNSSFRNLPPPPQRSSILSTTAASVAVATTTTTTTTASSSVPLISPQSYYTTTTTNNNSNSNNSSNTTGVSYVQPPPPLPQYSSNTTGSSNTWNSHSYNPTTVQPPPYLPSAPSSANISTTTTTPFLSYPSLPTTTTTTTTTSVPRMSMTLPPPPLPHQQQQQPSVVVVPPVTTSVPTIVQLPPPPLPPPVSILKSTTIAATTTTTSTSTRQPMTQASLAMTEATISSDVSSTSTLPPPFINWYEQVSSQSLQQTQTSSLSSNNNVSKVTATRQERVPILFIATASAHQMAYKNSLRLSDLFQGFVQTNSSSTSATTRDGISPSSSSHHHHHQTSSNSITAATTTIPFRSASRLLHIPLEQWQSGIQFIEEEHFALDMKGNDNDNARKTLQQVTILRPSDGNVQQELHVLEDTIDNLLSDDDQHHHQQQRRSHHYDSDPTTTTTDHNSNNDNTNTNINDSEQIYEQVVSDAYRLTSSSLQIPWLMRYRQACDACTNYLPYDQFHCPAIIVFVATTMEHVEEMKDGNNSNSQNQPHNNHNNNDIVATIRALQSNYHYWPQQYRNGMFDPTPVRREVLILHDNVEYNNYYNNTGTAGSEFDDASIRTQIKVCFGATATLLRINSLSIETAQQLAREEQTDIWGQHGQVGHCLTVGDRARIRKYITHIITNAVIPSMERRVSDLNVIVNDRKKGVKNVLKNFWGGNTRNKPEDDYNNTTAPNHSSNTKLSSSTNGSKNTDIIYRYDSIESQTRLLGDTLFLIRDYDAALSMYRLIKDDYKQDRNWIHYGSVQEMMALCMYMIDSYGRTRDIFSSIENALLSYSRAADEDATHQQPGRVTAAPISTRLGTRLCLVLLAAQHICIGRHLEVADLLASASSNETALGAAVLLEQSSVHYYKAEMYRKYSFHMLMSGHMFRTAEQDHHAFRCFTSALYIYRNSQWDELHNHVRSALAAQLFAMGRMSIALQLYAKLLGTTGGGRVSIKSQQKFVQNFLEICNDHRKKALSGADRMAAPPNLSGAGRDAIRTERLDRIVQVMRYTKSATRMLEIPNMTLPYIDDSTVVVIAEEAAHYRQESVESFGEAQVGATDVWDDLMLTMDAELKAEASNSNVRMTKSLLKIEDPDLRRVIALIEEQKSNRSKLERTKKSASYAQSAPVRAVKEPITIEFSIHNPLGIPIDVCDMQLVARMSIENGNRICTNEDAVSLRPLATSNEPMKWTFQSSNVVFLIPDFCRVSTERSGDTDIEAWKSAEDVEPFFVVTKSNRTIPPESKQIAAISICPLVHGNLEILGVRCRLFDSVWVFHPFNIKGPLLQNTRANRANRVRGESLLLKSKVERGMPCLSVELRHSGKFSTKDDGPALQDQIGDWTLRISNVGTASGCNVTLKTNLPWIDVCDSSDSTNSQSDSEQNALSRIVGPTGTLMKVPIVASSLQKSGLIQPGETIDVPIKIKTSGFGKTDFYMLFRYELYAESDKVEIPRCRWLKKMFCVPVYPALGMTAAVTSTFVTPHDYLLSLELTNCRTDRPDLLDVALNTLTIASRHYVIEPIVPSSSYVSLGWQERATIHFRLKGKDAEKEKYLLSHSHLSQSDNASKHDNPPTLSVLNFLALERAHDSFEEALREYQMALARAAASGEDESQPLTIAAIRRANTVESSSQMGDDMYTTENKYESYPTSIERLCPLNGTPDTIHVLCSWDAHDKSICGQNHIRGLLVRPLTAPPSNSSCSCPISIACAHQSHVSHDFTVGPAIVPMTVTLCNKLIASAVQLDIIMNPTNTFDVTGPEQYRITLRGGEQICIAYHALISDAGVYNLQNLRLLVLSVSNHNNNNNSTNEPLPYTFPHQWMVTVDSTERTEF